MSEYNMILHPAAKYNYSILQKELYKRVKDKVVSKKTIKGYDLELFCYNMRCIEKKSWDIFTIMARGLVLCPSKKMVVNYPFVKFFNYGEVTELPNEQFTVTEKLDGSLIIIFHYDGQWFVTTKGSFDSEQAKWAYRYLSDNKIFDKLIPGNTYLMEAIYKSNRIVVQYDFEGLVLLGVYDHRGREIVDISTISERIGIDIPKMFDYSIQDMIKYAKTLPIDTEGFVIRFKNGYRIKIKGEEYCRMHRLISQCSPLTIWSMLMVKDDDRSMRENLPEEFKRDFDIILGILQKQFSEKYEQIEKFHYKTIHMDDKELGIYMQNSDVNLPKYVKNLVFACRKKNWLQVVKEKPDKQDHARARFFRSYLRPNNNILEGYTPSTAANRFQESII